jgi:hypothetical protein
MDPRLQRYWLSKWTCPTHGEYIARTREPIQDPERRPIPCPECVSIFKEQIQGMTVQPVPFVSKPRWPRKNEVMDETFSDKAPLRKRRTMRW